MLGKPEFGDLLNPNICNIRANHMLSRLSCKIKAIAYLNYKVMVFLVGKWVDHGQPTSGNMP